MTPQATAIAIVDPCTLPSLKERVIARIERQKPLLSGEGPTFCGTNENIEQIVAGLRPTPDDRILAICGSGDQAFALAEYGARVYAVDNDPEQIAYARQRATLLRQRRYDVFLSINRAPPIIDASAMEGTIDYFTRKGCLTAVRSHVDRVSLHTADIFNLPEELKIEYTKAYLSNAHYYWGSSTHHELHGVAERIVPGGIVYACGILHDRLEDCCGLQEDRETTRQIERLGDFGWKPTVYVKRSTTTATPSSATPKSTTSRHGG